MTDRLTRRQHTTQRGLDPKGKRALFEAPVEAPADHLRPGPARSGRDALFSTGPRQRGTAVVECDGCGARSRVSLADLGLRLVSFSVWIPGRRHAHWLSCPACGHRTWCRIGWDE